MKRLFAPLAVALAALALPANADRVAVGNAFGAVVEDDGDLFVWGANQSGQLADGTTNDRPTPRRIEPAGVWEQVSASRNAETATGEGHFLAIRENGTLWAWGENASGQLGLGDTEDRQTPTQVTGSADWIDVAAGGAFSMALNADGRVFVWGDNSSGQLARPAGDGPVLTPVALDNETYIDVEAGADFAFAIRSTAADGSLTSTGTLHAWGQNNAGQIGIGEKSAFPVREVDQVGSAADWFAVSAGRITAFGLRGSPAGGGALYAWGNASNGSLGLGGAIGAVRSPRRVGSASDWTTVSAGTQHGLALQADGSLWGWGDNTSGSLGLPVVDQNGNTIFANQSKATPTPLLAGRTFQDVAAGDFFSAALASGGALLTTGENQRGELANGDLGTRQIGFADSFLGRVDLAVDTVEVTAADPAPGDSVGLSVILRNAGTGELAANTPDLAIEAILSSDSILGNGDDRQLSFQGGGTEFAVTDAIGVGENVSIAPSVALPSSIAAGDYTLFVRADVNDVVQDPDPDNDLGQTPEPLSFRADLRVASLTVSAGGGSFPVRSGDDLEATVEIENAGSGDIVATSFDTRLLLTPERDAGAPGAVDLAASIPFSGDLDAGTSRTFSFTGADAFALPDNLGIGDFFAAAVADVGDAVVEADEDNNEGFTATAAVEVAGIPLNTALDNAALVFETVGEGRWFGQDNASQAGGSAAQSPPLSEGQSAAIRTEVAEASLLTFRWRAATTSSDNTLEFDLVGADSGGERNVISGSQDWVEVSRVVPAGVQIRWTYTEGQGAPDDAVFLDDVQVAPINDPDLVVDDASLTSGGTPVEEGRFVLGQDRLDLSVQTRNQGLATDSGETFDVSIYLSTNGAFEPASDIRVKTLTVTDPFLAGESNVLLPSVELPTSIDSGDYHLVVVADPDNRVTEVGDDPPADSPVQENNVFVSDTANVEIAALPDVTVDSVTPEPGFYLVGDRIDFSLSLKNKGLRTVTDSFPVRIALSDDPAVDANDYVVGEFPFRQGLGEAGSSGSSATVQPDIADVRADVPVGRFLYFGALADTDDSIEELNEGNNGDVFDDPDFFFAELPLEEAVEFDESGIDAANNDSVPFDGPAPFYGQTETTFANEPDAAQSAAIGDGQTAAFSTTITAETDTVVSFKWKVSSERTVLEDGSIKEDTLNFFVDDMDNPVRSISGEENWTEVSVFVEAGAHTLRWTYEKDASESSGQDAGWIDRFNFQLPDLVVSRIDFPGASLTAGVDTLDFDFAVANEGVAAAPENPSYDIEARISEDAVFDADEDVLLTTLSSGEGLASGATTTFNVSEPVPAFFANAGDFFIVTRVNSTGSVPEANSNNNTLSTSAPNLTITPPVSLNQGVDDPNAGGPGAIDFDSGGAGGWFGVEQGTLADGSDSTFDGVDAVRSGPAASQEESFFKTIVQGPKVLTFRWKVDSRRGANFLEFLVNGEVRESISGQVDWDFGYGPFTLSFEGETSAPIAANAPAADVESALNDMGAIADAGGVSVTGGPLEYTIAFNANGNRDPLEFAARKPEKVVSASVDSVQGGASTAETQTLTIEPNVFFNLVFRGERTDAIAYTADAADVQSELNAVPAIQDAGGVTVADAGGGPLDFVVTFNDPGERESIEIDPGGLRQPATTDNDVATQGTSGAAQEQEIRVGAEVTVFIPAGSQELTWRYRKTGNAGEFIDAGWVDRIELTDWTAPELKLSDVDYTPGEYVLDVDTIVDAGTQLLGTRFFDVTVEAANQGTNLPQSVGGFSPADLEVRLSSDSVYGNADDIVLGSFNQVEGDLESGGLMRFLGPLPLGDNIPEGTYHVMAKVDSDERVAEFAEANNVFISPNRDVRITRLPHIERTGLAGPIAGNDVANAADEALPIDETKRWFTGDPVEMRFQLQNIGLGRVEGDQPWESTVELVGIKKEDMAGFFEDGGATLADFQDASTPPFPLGSFSVEELLLGRGFDEASGTQFPGDRLTIETELALPGAGRLLESGILEDDLTIGDYVFYLRLTIDAGNAVRESDVVNRWDSFDTAAFLSGGAIDPTSGAFVSTAPDDGFFELRPVGQPLALASTIDASSWAAAYDGRNGTSVSEPSPGGADSDNDGRSDFLEYAFNRNPTVSDSEGIFGSFGKATVGDEDFLTLTFDVVAGAQDLVYRVEGDDNAMFGSPETLAMVEPPYTAETGVGSLTGDGGLIDGGSLTENDPDNARDFVLNVVDHGYTARVTVRDSQAMDSGSSRFMRIVVEKVGDGSSSTPGVD